MSRELRCEAEGLLWRDVRRQLLRELVELYLLHWAPEALQRGGGAEAARRGEVLHAAAKAEAAAVAGAAEEAAALREAAERAGRQCC